MDLEIYLRKRFLTWSPAAPEAIETTKRTITLKWNPEPFGFISDKLIYRVEKKEKIPPWIVVYSGGKTEKLIDNLPPRHPQKFRLKIILSSTSVTSLANRAIKAFGGESKVYDHFAIYDEQKLSKEDSVSSGSSSTKEKPQESIKSDIIDDSLNSVDVYKTKDGDTNPVEDKKELESKGDKKFNIIQQPDPSSNNIILQSVTIDSESSRPWLESQWSEETWTSTDTDGTSATCFCMAVKCGYLKQVQVMLDERPDLIGIINSKNGFTPLATAIRKGELSTVKFLLSAGADLEQCSSTQQTPLQLAVLSGRVQIAALLLDRGADAKARDLNGLRAEHYAVDSGCVEMLQLVLDRGGDLTVLDNNGWTPLFRAICQGAKTDMISELISRGSDVTIHDYAGLPLTTAARLLKNRHGRGRESLLRLVDAQYPHEKALEHFTRLTKKISSVQSILK